MIVPSDQPAAVDVSICIVNWNSSHLLAELLESIKDEGGAASIEAVVVDNASTDDSVAMMRARFPWVRLIQNETNAGFARANNQAAAAARGRHLFFINNDTRLFPGCASTLAAYLDEHPQVSAVGPKTFLGTGVYHCSCRRLPTWPVLLHRLRLFHWTRLFARADARYRMTGMNADETQPVQQMDGAALMVRRTALDAVGGWDEAFTFGLEDVDLCARLAQVGPLMYVPAASIVHHGSVSQVANQTYAIRNFEAGYARYLAKHGRSRLTAPAYKLLVTLDQLSLVFRFAWFAIKSLNYRWRGRYDLLARHRHWLESDRRFALNLRSYWRVSAPRHSRRADAITSAATSAPRETAANP